VSSGERIEVWQERDGLWRWRYRNDDGVDLLSNESHLSREETVHSASVAYPGVPVDDRPPGPPGLGLGRTARVAALGGGGLALAAVVALPVAIGLAWRRLWRKLDPG
jgi:hypothetical protein